MRVLVIANRADPETGFVGEALAARGAVFEQVWREDTDVPLPPAGAHDVVLSLGSEWSVYWPDHSTAVEREADLLRGSVEAEVPVLGICFGAQLLAHALGGAVEPAPSGGEVGWYTVETDVPELIPSGPYLQWHSDRFQVPPRAVELARSPWGRRPSASAPRWPCSSIRRRPPRSPPGGPPRTGSSWRPWAWTRRGWRRAARRRRRVRACARRSWSTASSTGSSNGSGQTTVEVRTIPVSVVTLVP